MIIFEWTYLIAAFAIFYTYIIYPIALIALSGIFQAIADTAFVFTKQDRRKRFEECPDVTVLISAFNEEQCIQSRVENLLSLDYPSDKLKILIGSDGSTDNTNAILSDLRDPRIETVFFERNRGKVNVLNDLVSHCRTPFCLFSDANTFWEPKAIRLLLKDFQLEKVGGVCGQLELIDHLSGANRDSLYWRYEQVLKFHESRINGTLGANGAIYAIRTHLYRPLPTDTIIDDFCVFMNVARQGYRLTYNPEARATERVAPDLKAEAARRLRIGAGNYQAMIRHTWLLNPLLGWRWFTYFSHKLVRWFVPHLAIVCLLLNIPLAVNQPLYQGTLLMQILFYSIFIWGKHRPRLAKGPFASLVTLVTFFVSMNISLGQGFIRFMTSNLSATWQRTPR